MFNFGKPRPKKQKHGATFAPNLARLGQQLAKLGEGWLTQLGQALVDFGPDRADSGNSWPNWITIRATRASSAKLGQVWSMFAELWQTMASCWPMWAKLGQHLANSRLSGQLFDNLRKLWTTPEFVGFVGGDFLGCGAFSQHSGSIIISATTDLYQAAGIARSQGKTREWRIDALSD